MSDALAMPGDMVSPNDITLKDGYLWEVRPADSCLRRTCLASRTHAHAPSAAHTVAVQKARAY